MCYDLTANLVINLWYKRILQYTSEHINYYLLIQSKM